MTVVEKSMDMSAAVPNSRMFLSVAVAMAGAIMFGLDQGNFGNVQSFKSFQDYWCLGKYGDEYTCGAGAGNNHQWQQGFVLWGASLITVGAACGAFTLGPYLSEGHGRRICIFSGGVICTLGCLFASYLNFRSVGVFMVARFVTGYGVGICCFALPVYNAEVATPGVRGATGSFFQLFVVLGCFISTLLTLVCQEWRFGMMLPGFAGIVVSIAVMFIPESPRYVMNKRGYDAGIEELKKVRRGDVTMEAREMETEIASSRDCSQVSFAELFTKKGLRRRVFIACWLQVAQQLTGVNAFLGYASTIFDGVGMKDPYMFNAIWNFVMIVGCVAGLLLVDSRYGGRRPQLLGATWLMGPPLFIAGIAVALEWSGVIAMVMVCVYGLGFQLAWGMIPWIYPAEIFSMSEKERAVSFAVFNEFAANGLIVIITPLIMTASVPGTLFAFGALNMLNLVFVFFYIKETKGVPLSEVPRLFERPSTKN